MRHFCMLVIQCPTLNTSHANVSSTDIDFGATVNISCLPGYIINGQTTATVNCTSTGQWSLNTSCLRKCKRSPHPPQNTLLFVAFVLYRVVQKTVPQFYFCDNFRKCTPILTIFSLLEPEIYDA